MDYETGKALERHEAAILDIIRILKENGMMKEEKEATKK